MSSLRKSWLKLPGVPAHVEARKTHQRTPRKYLRASSHGVRFGRRKYHVEVTLILTDGTKVLGHRIGPAESTRFQAKKLLARVRRDIPLAYIGWEQQLK